MLIRVRVMRAEAVGNQGDNVQDIPGFTVKGNVDNTAVGTLSAIGDVTGWDSNAPGYSDWKFLAQKAGKATVSFTSTIKHVWWGLLGALPVVDRKDTVSATVTETVVDCTFKVSEFSQWFFTQGTGGSISLVMSVEDAVMRRDDNGHYEGTGAMNWIPDIVLPPGCSHTDTIPPSQVNLSGDINASDQLVVQLTFEAASLTETHTCKKTVTNTFPLNPQPLQFTVPASGGVASKSHTLSAAGQSVSGPSAVNVSPEGTK